MKAKDVCADDLEYDLPARTAMRTVLRHVDLSANMQETASDRKLPVPQKRKVSNLVAVDEPKRRCCDSYNKTWDKLAIDTHLQGEHYSDDSAYSNAEGSSNGQHQGPTVCAQLHTNIAQRGRKDSACWSPDTLPVDSKILTAHNAIEVDPILEQKIFMRNYHEFADRKLFKDMGLLISPVSEGESQAYERIFMDSSEVCSPTSDESAMDLNASAG